VQQVISDALAWVVALLAITPSASLNDWARGFARLQVVQQRSLEVDVRGQALCAASGLQGHIVGYYLTAGGVKLGEELGVFRV
jgi:hypothetical protein